MKMIISHDIDHLTVWEHRKDLVIPKFLIRSFIEFSLGRIPFKEMYFRLVEITKNKWQNLEELMLFDKEQGVEATFFIGVSNGQVYDGLRLNYSLRETEFWLKKIITKGFDIGVHGICYREFEGIKGELETFKRISGFKSFGIRMHYLRTDENALNLLAKAGYLFDSSVYDLKNPFKVGNMWEFPLHIMDGYVFHKNCRWQNVSLGEAKDDTKRQIEKAYEKGINYFTVLFHDRYFSEAFKQMKEWYIWLINYIRGSGFSFVNYRNAIKGLEGSINVR